MENKMYQLKYFKFGDELCGSDFNNLLKTEHINLQQISSISGIKKFCLPLSGEYKGDYVTVSMVNGDLFCINKDEYSKILKSLKEPEFCEWERKLPLLFIHTSCGVEELSMSGLIGDKEIEVLSEKHCKLCPICQKPIKLKEKTD